MMKRKEDWPELLDAAIRDRSSIAFAWGANDCILFSCSVIEAMTGIDPAASLRGTYKDAFGALAAVTSTGATTLSGMVSTLAGQQGLKEIPHKMAQRGDLVCFTQESTNPAFDVVFGIVGHCGKDAVCVSDEGLKRISVLKAVKAWRVG
jgi:hypothetical protein